MDMYVTCIHILKTYIHIHTLLGVNINVSFVAHNRNNRVRDVSIEDLEEGVCEYKKLIHTIMDMADDIHSLVHNTLYNSLIQPSIHMLYNVYCFICTLCVQLMDIYHTLSLVYGGGGYKYLYAYTINSSLYNNSHTILTENIHISKVIYTCIHALTRCVVYLYDMSMPTHTSASYLYACFYMMVCIYDSVGSMDACIHYYNNIYKLFSQVVVMRNAYVLCKLYKDFAFILYESGDYQQAQVIYMLAIQEYKTVMYGYIHKHYPDQVMVSSQHTHTHIHTQHTGVSIPSQSHTPTYTQSPSLSPYPPSSSSRTPPSSSKAPLDPMLLDSKVWVWGMESLECLVFKTHTHIQLQEYAEAQNHVKMAYTHFLYLYTGDGGAGGVRYDGDGVYDDDYIQSLNIDLPLLHKLHAIHIQHHHAGMVCMMLHMYAHLFYVDKAYKEALIYHFILLQMLMWKYDVQVESPAHTHTHASNKYASKHTQPSSSPSSRPQFTIHLDISKITHSDTVYDRLYTESRYETKEMAATLHNMGIVLYAMVRMSPPYPLSISIDITISISIPMHVTISITMCMCMYM
ncbi:hypothetical protein EON63_16990 [archaeon]|nr:MAG: hypothetical protein EON63_16990 [archaeon]